MYTYVTDRPKFLLDNCLHFVCVPEETKDDNLKPYVGKFFIAFGNYRLNLGFFDDSDDCWDYINRYPLLLIAEISFVAIHLTNVHPLNSSSFKHE